MKKIFILLALLTSSIYTMAQDLPVKTWYGSDATKPLILYFSGDGGFNGFTSNMCKEMNAAGYPVIALNTRSYFWKKKAAKTAATEIAKYLNSIVSAGKKVVIVGYSFGGDVAPFIIPELSKLASNTISKNILISPSNSTDMEVHISELLGSNVKRELDVPSAINKLSAANTLVIKSQEDNTFDVHRLTLPKSNLIVLAGDHNFNDNYKLAAKTVMNFIK